MATVIDQAKKGSTGIATKARVRVRLESIVPCLQDRVDDDTIANLIAGTSAKATKAAVKTPEQIADMKLYRGPSGEYGFPARNVWAALCQAGTGVKFDKRRNISSGTSGTLLPQFLEMEGGEFLAFSEHAEPQVDKGTGRMQATGGMVVCIRPRFDTWSLELSVVVDEREIDLERVKILFMIAGHKGLGTYRPGKSKTGYYGRFRVAAFEVIERVEVEAVDVSILADEEEDQPAAADVVSPN